MRRVVPFSQLKLEHRRGEDGRRSEQRGGAQPVCSSELAPLLTAEVSERCGWMSGSRATNREDSQASSAACAERPAPTRHFQTSLFWTFTVWSSQQGLTLPDLVWILSPLELYRLHHTTHGLTNLHKELHERHPASKQRHVFTGRC